jgi:hypothetical protein
VGTDPLKDVAVSSFVVLVFLSFPTLVGAETGGHQDSQRTGRLGVESPRAWSRAELTIFQAFHGMTLATQICLMAECETTRESYDSSAASLRPFGSVLLGLGVGVGVPLLATRNGILPGHAVSLNSGVLWGLWYGTAVGTMAGTLNSFSSRSARIAPLLAGQLGGLALGAGLYQVFEPTQGDVALVNSFGLWTGLFTAGSFGLARGPVNGKAVAGTMMATTTAAAVGAGFLARRAPMSRRRVWTINGSGILGGLLASGITLLSRAPFDKPRLLSGMAMLGSAAGLGIGAWLTDDWSKIGKASSEATAQLHLAPSPRGSGGMVQVSGSF